MADITRKKKGEAQAKTEPVKDYVVTAVHEFDYARGVSTIHAAAFGRLIDLLVEKNLITAVELAEIMAQDNTNLSITKKK